VLTDTGRCLPAFTMEGMTDDMPGADAGPPRAGAGAHDGSRTHDEAPAGGSRPGAPGFTGAAGGGPAGTGLLSRSRRVKVLGGVCGGLGRYFGIDPVIFRVVLAILALTGGIGLISYGIGWLLIPMDGEEETEIRRLLSGRIEASSMTAVFCALVGSGLFLSTLNQGKDQAFSVCLAGAVVAAVYWSQRRRAALAAAASASAPPDAAASGPVRDAPPAAKAPPTGDLSWWRTTSGKVSFEKTGVKAGEAAGAGRRPEYLWGPDDSYSGTPQDDGPRREARKAQIQRERTERGQALLGLLAFLLAVVAGWIGATASWHTHSLRTIAETGLVAALGVLGLGLVVGAFAGVRIRGVTGWAVLASLLLAGASVIPASVGTDWHETTWRPATAAAVRPVYRLGAGQGVLDLSGLALHGTENVNASVDMGAGRLQVRVPRNATLRLDTRVGLGDVWFPVPGHHDVTISPGRRRTGTFAPAGGVKPAGTITLTLRLGAGQVEVRRDPAA
jgi:phage shock protein PspC (stress-responsive transcriptional regulator)